MRTALVAYDVPASSDLTTWTSPTGALLRQLATADGDPLFVAKDVCEALGLGSVSTACRKLDEDEKGSDTITTPGGPQKLVTVTEPGLYKLIMRSNRPDAAAFTRWVTHEVLPSIRRTGNYQAPKPGLVRAPNEGDEKGTQTLSTPGGSQQLSTREASARA